MLDLKQTQLIGVCFMLLHGFLDALNCSSPTPESMFEALEKELFSKKQVPPVKSFSSPVYVTLRITVLGILGMNEKAQSMTMVLWMDLTWLIEGFTWDEKECGTRQISVRRENLWVPDIHISEFIDEPVSPDLPFVFLNHSGYVYDDKPLRVISSCRLVIYTFPFDVQNCTLTFGSFLHTDSYVRMVVGATAEEILETSKSVIETNGEWELHDIIVSPELLILGMYRYSEIKYHFVLRRRPTLYVVNLLIPSCFLITVDLCSFFLPPLSVDRSSFKMTLILGYTVFLLIMNDLLPATGETTPLINVFFSISLALMVASLLETILITNIQFTSRSAPQWLSTLVLKYLAVLVCIPPKKEHNRVTVSLQPSMESVITSVSIANNSVKPFQSISSEVLEAKHPPDLQQTVVDLLKMLSKDLLAIRLRMDSHFQGTIASEEWYMIAKVIDRLLFVIYIIFILTSFMTIISIWIWRGLID